MTGSQATQQQGGNFTRVASIGQRLNYGPDSRTVLHDICTHLAGIRQIPAPEIPKHVYHAWDNYVGPGAFFIKYPNRGSCHERFFDLRMLDSDAGTREPYLVWFKHEKAHTRQGMMHLNFLQGVETGVRTDAFDRFLLPLQYKGAQRMIKGPFGDGQRTMLPTDLAMSIYFHTPETQAVSLLSTNESIFQAWRCVMNFLGDINRSHMEFEDDEWDDLGEDADLGEEKETEGEDDEEEYDQPAQGGGKPPMAPPPPPPYEQKHQAPQARGDAAKKKKGTGKKNLFGAGGDGQQQPVVLSQAVTGSGGSKKQSSSAVPMAALDPPAAGAAPPATSGGGGGSAAAQQNADDEEDDDDVDDVNDNVPVSEQ